MSAVTPQSRIEVPLLDLKAQYATIREEVRGAMDRVMESQYFILGPEVKALEAEVARYSGVGYGIGVSSGTDALLVALMALDIQSGDEVITTPYSFFATAGCIVRLGAVPVFVDIDPLTYNLDPTLLEAAITPRTKAVIPVHLYGQMADMDPIVEIANRHKLAVIEDAAQAIGAEYKGKRAGSLGDIGCFSFFPSKNLGGVGDGGMIVTNNRELAERLDILRKHGAQPKYYHKFVGGNFRLDALQAAVLRVKLTYLDGWTEGRQENAHTYRKLLNQAGLAHPTASTATATDYPLVLPLEQGDGRHIYNQFVLRCKQRNELMAYLQEHQIGCEVYYPVALHLQECFGGLGYQPDSMPHSERAAQQTLAIPIYPELTADQLERVVEVIGDFYN
ncbi:MAG: DegT/DnrJ/EryC1/StrS family aminotransferase [Caldilineaceae bacterium]